jgi:hypothetical protein
MKPLNFPEDNSIKPSIMRERLRYGFFYGAVAGLAFAGVTWCWDAVLLTRSHALFPALKLVLGLASCWLVGGIAGWLVMRFDRGLAAILIWLGAALAFAWLVTFLPLQIAPRISVWLEPELQGLISYPDNATLVARLGLAFVWVAIFSAIVGALQLPLSDSAIFSTSTFNKIAPALVCIVIMGINGTVVDGLNNAPLRSGLLSVNDTIQFAVDHQNQTVDQKEALHMHLGALRNVREHINRPRKLIVGGSDEFLGEVIVLVRFGDVWVSCVCIYNQPTNCQVVRPKNLQ